MSDAADQVHSEIVAFRVAFEKALAKVVRRLIIAEFAGIGLFLAALHAFPG